MRRSPMPSRLVRRPFPRCAPRVELLEQREAPTILFQLSMDTTSSVSAAPLSAASDSWTRTWGVLSLEERSSPQTATWDHANNAAGLAVVPASATQRETAPAQRVGQELSLFEETVAAPRPARGPLLEEVAQALPSAGGSLSAPPAPSAVANLRVPEAPVVVAASHGAHDALFDLLNAGLAGSAAAATASSPNNVLDPNFTQTTYLDNPDVANGTGMAWATDGSNRLFLTLKGGAIRVIENGVLRPEPFAVITPLHTAGHCGLIGIALDPDFAVNHYLYVFATVTTSEQQIFRFTDVNSVGVDRRVVLGGLPSRGAINVGGGLSFGPDGKLYFSVGDLGNRSGANEDLTTLASKIGRTNPDGTAPTDNPFYDGAGPNNDYIWGRGYRNVFKLTHQPGAGYLWANGPGEDYDQVWLAGAGDHAGWDRYENNQPEGFLAPLIKYRVNGTDLFDLAAGGAVRADNVATFTTTQPHGLRRGERVTIAGVGTASFNGSFYVTGMPTPTTFTVAQAGPNETSGGGTVETLFYGGSITGGTFYNGTAFPAAYRGNFFFGDFNSGYIMRAALDEHLRVSTLDIFAQNEARYIDMATGTDGALYALSYTGVLHRIAANHTEPRLSATPAALQITEGSVAAVGLSLTRAPAAPLTVYTFFWDGDEDLVVAAGEALTFTPQNFGVPQTVWLYAADDADAATDWGFFLAYAPELGFEFLFVTTRDVQA